MKSFEILRAVLIGGTVMLASAGTLPAFADDAGQDIQAASLEGGQIQTAGDETPVLP